MGSYHTVAKGEHLPQIAARYGRHDPLVVWNAPENSKLRELRKDPGVLFAGDRVFIPDPVPKTWFCHTGSRHVFRLGRPSTLLRMVLKDLGDEPLAGITCELRVGGRTIRLTSDHEGLLEAEIDAGSGEGRLVLEGWDSQPGLEIPIRIGDLDPVEEPSGQLARLASLGYYRGPEQEPDEAQFRSALEEFQCDQGLEVTGECDGPTCGRLVERHGC